MKTVLTWTEGMQFNAVADHQTIKMDAKSPLGQGLGPTPKELVAMGLGGCTAMDVIALLKKYKQLPKTFNVSVDIITSSGKTPAVFESARITFEVVGELVTAEKLSEAVHLSQTKYCGVSAMLAKAFEITYLVKLNGQEISQGRSEFAI